MANKATKKSPLTRCNAEGADEIAQQYAMDNNVHGEHYQADRADSGSAPADDLKGAQTKGRRAIRTGRSFNDLSNAQIIKAFGGGDQNGDWINVPGPGHSQADRTLGLKRDESKPYGFALNSLANDDFETCLQYVVETLNLASAGGANNSCTTQKQQAKKRIEANAKTTEKKIESFKSHRDKWDGALPSDSGKHMERYFEETRGVRMAEGVHRLRQLQYDPRGVTIEPGQILSLIEDFETFEPCGIHRIGIERIGTPRVGEQQTREQVVKFRGCLGKDGKYDWSRGVKTWVTNEGVIRLLKGGNDTDTLCVAEGVETAYSFQNFPLGVEQPAIWSLVTSTNYKKFKPLPQFKTLYIAGDIEPSGAGEKGVEELAANWSSAGRKVYIIRPILKPGEAKRDLNNIAQDCSKEGRQPEEGRDYTVELIEPGSMVNAGGADSQQDDPHSWPDGVDKAGRPKPTMPNSREALCRLGVQIRYNEFGC